MADTYANIRDPELLGPLVGARVVDVTQHDEDDWLERGDSFVCLHFDNGMIVRFPIGEEPFVMRNHPAGDGGAFFEGSD